MCVVFTFLPPCFLPNYANYTQCLSRFLRSPTSREVLTDCCETEKNKSKQVLPAGIVNVSVRIWVFYVHTNGHRSPRYCSGQLQMLLALGP